MQRWLLLLTLLFLILCVAGKGMAAGLEVNNITVATQAEDGVKARDMAINKAQRMAFGALVGKGDLDIDKINDTQIARLVKGFSVQGERLSARSYRANFTIRFLSAPTYNFASSMGWELVPQAANGQPIVFDNNAAAALNVAVNVGAPAPIVAGEAVPAATPVTQNYVVLPVLDIGSRRIVWDDPNPWREAWQEGTHTLAGATINLPLGDVDDVTDLPDAAFLNGNGKANISHMLERYHSTKLYVVIAKNMGAALDTTGGMSLSLYSHDGQQLKFIRKLTVHPRPGFLFNDAVPAAIQMISQSNGKAVNTESSTTINSDVLDNTGEGNNTPLPAETVTSQPISGSLTVIVPYQSLQQWVSIQKRLRVVPGVRSVFPIRVSASAAQVKIMTSTSSTDDLSRNLSLQHFVLQKMSNGELTLVDQ